MPTQIQLRRGTAAQWTSTNPTLASGELGVETDTGKIKVGSGSTAWTSLPYSSGGIGGSNTQVQYNNAGAFGGSANFVWDNSNVRLGIGTSSPSTSLHVVGSSSAITATVSSTSTTINGAPSLKVINTGSSTTNQLAEIHFRYEDGTYNANGAIAALRESGTARGQSFIFAPSDSLGNAAERMRITSAGNVGIGVTPSAWASGMKVLQFANGATVGSLSATYALFAQNYYYDGTNNIYLTTNSASLYAQYGGQHQWYTAPSGTAGTAITFTERMRIDSNGRVGINTTSQTTNLARLQVNHDPATDRYGVYVPGGQYVSSGPSGNQYGGYFVPHVSNSTSGFQCGVYGSANPNGVGSALYGGYFDGQGSATNPNYGVYAVARQSDLNGPNTATGGWFNVNTTSSGSGSLGGTISVRAENTATLGSSAIGVSSSTVAGASNIYGYYYTHAGSLQFRVKLNGGIDNYSSNNTNLSDRREKTDFASAKSYLDTICAIPVQTFKYINQEDDLPTLGVVAQDVQAVAPELVNESDWGTQEEPKMRLSVYETDLMYALMKSIQELKAIVDAQAARIAVFEGN